MSNRELGADELKDKLQTDTLRNSDPREGFALVNVLSREDFEKEHIPGSINIPLLNIETVEKKFDKGKEIVVYCASESCPASEKAASKLEERGFRNVVDFRDGTDGWKKSGYQVQAA